MFSNVLTAHLASRYSAVVLTGPRLLSTPPPPHRRLKWIRRDSSLGASLCPPPKWPALLWDDPLTTGHHGEHTAVTPSPEPSSPGGPAGTSAGQLGDGLHRERRGLLHRVRDEEQKNKKNSLYRDGKYFSVTKLHDSAQCDIVLNCTRHKSSSAVKSPPSQKTYFCCKRSWEVGLT